jgi:hypothetical protein
LAATLIMLVGASMLVTGAFVMTDLHARAGLNRESAVRATHVAEAGLTHALSVLRAELQGTSFTRLLRGSDSVGGTPDDGYLSGYGLSSALAIPSTGFATSGGRYYVRLVDDPVETDNLPMTDSNGRIRVHCTGQTPDGAVAEIEAIVSMTSLPGFVVDGGLTISGNPVISGACGSVHANGTLVISGTTRVEQYAASSQTVQVDASKLQNLSGTPVAPRNGQPRQEVPTIDPWASYCTAADYAKIDYVMQSNGYILVVATGQLLDARSDPKLGWKRSSTSPLMWDGSGDQVAPGTFCVQGSVKLSGNPGTATNPLPLSIIATGSLEISGNPHITSDHPDGLSLVVGGDLSISGNPDAYNNYVGTLYAGSKCKISGDPTIQGQITCKNLADPPGAVNWTDENLISGSPRLRLPCNSLVPSARRILFWYPRFGS